MDMENEKPFQRPIVYMIKVVLHVIYHLSALYMAHGESEFHVQIFKILF